MEQLTTLIGFLNEELRCDSVKLSHFARRDPTPPPAATSA